MRIRYMVSTSRQRVPTSLLPTETVIHDPQGRFSFEIPWPWFQWKGEFDLRSPQRDDRIVLFAPRTTDPWPEASVWSTPESFDLGDRVLKSESRRLAQNLGGRGHRPRRLEVGGAPAAGFLIECSDTLTHKVTIAAHEVTAIAVFRLPLRVAAGYAAHVETMLATWEWAREPQ